MLRRATAMRCPRRTAAAVAPGAVAFARRKVELLRGIATAEGDRSIAGGVDAGVRPLVDALNRCAGLCTTSSCSGRLSLFHRGGGGSGGGGMKRGGGGAGFVYVSHARPADVDVPATAAVLHALLRKGMAGDAAEAEAAQTAIAAATVAAHEGILGDEPGKFDCPPGAFAAGGVVELKFEPVILHVLCADAPDADRLIAAAHAAGLRRTGMWRRPVRWQVSSADDAAAALRREAEAVEELGGPAAPTAEPPVPTAKAAGTVEGHVVTTEIGASFGFNTLVAVDGESLISGEAALGVMLRHANRLFDLNASRKARLAEELARRF